MFSSIEKHLKTSINKAGISKQVEAAVICELWKEVVDSIFGKKVASRSQAVMFKNGILTVSVLNSILAQEFKFNEEKIKNNINKKVKCNAVKKIRFKI